MRIIQGLSDNLRVRITMWYFNSSHLLCAVEISSMVKHLNVRTETQIEDATVCITRCQDVYF